MTSPTRNRRSKLDRAVIASVIAMAALNAFVLTQQLQPAPALAHALAPALAATAGGAQAA